MQHLLVDLGGRRIDEAHRIGPAETPGGGIEVALAKINEPGFFVILLEVDPKSRTIFP
jgi:hypothetical protein